MDLFQAITTRRSVRKYKPIEVEWSKIADILEAGRHAPSAGNLQDWRFIVVRDRANIVALSAAAYDQHWMETAPVCIVVCSDLRNTEKLYGVRGTRLYTIQNSSAAIENMLLVSHAHGLGSCWVGAFDEEEVSGILHLPPFIRAQAIITLGYPNENPKEPLKSGIETVTYFEGWAAQSAKKIDYSELLKYAHEYGTLNELRLNNLKNKISTFFLNMKNLIVNIFHSKNQDVDSNTNNTKYETYDNQKNDNQDNRNKDDLI